MKIKNITISLIGIFLIFGCTDLEENLNSSVAEGANFSASDLLTGAYSSLRELQHEQDLLPSYVHSSDELIPPTRGGDWDDAGLWRDHHLHGWTNTHAHIDKTWRDLNSRSFNAAQVLCAGDATLSEAAQAIFLRTFTDFFILDLFGVVPRRECGEDLLLPPTQQLDRINGVDVLISELEEVFDDLPSGTDPTIATQNGARMLLAKLYLNRAVYKATAADGGAQEGPYTFESADMTSVVNYINDINGRELEDEYFSSFIPANSQTSTEIIFVSENDEAGATGRINNRWHMSMHYNQQPSGWNGFVATVELYNLFEDGDVRKSSSVDGLSDTFGYNAGFLLGQQRGPLNGDLVIEDLKDRQQEPLIFTEDVDLFNSDERRGIRVVKYIPNTDFNINSENNSLQFGNDDAPGNDYVFFRYADALLMKAEAILRGGTDSQGETALTIVSELRQIRNASDLGTVSLDDILDERARELYWEGWRRNDQIRFGTFLGTWQEKETASTAKSLLMPIPAEALATNPNLTQNPGY